MAAAALVTGSALPAATGTPAAAIRFLALILSPICSMAPGGGPTQIRPSASTWRAKPGFSARNPYPGWMAAAPVRRAAASTAPTSR